MVLVSFIRSLGKYGARRVAFSPSTTAVVELVLGITFLWWFGKITTIPGTAIWLSIRLGLWILLISLTTYTAGLSRLMHYLALFVFQLGLTALLFVMDRSLLWYGLMAAGVMVPVLSFWLLPRLRSELSFMGRPHMRFSLAMTVFGLAGIWSGIAAMITFTVFSPVWWIAFDAGGAVFSMLIAFVWWWYYLKTDVPSILRTMLLFGWLLLQLSVIALFWPTGFLSQGLLIAWIWYILWLTLRYHLSEQGIDPRRHAYFLIGNGAVMLVFLLFLARWK